MEKFENTLPSEQSVNENVIEFYGELHDIFEDYQQNEGDIISIDSESQHNIANLSRFSRDLGEVYAHDDEGRVKAADTIYRAICFGSQVADEVLPGYYECPLVGYTSSCIDAEGSRVLDRLRLDSQNYLVDRPQLDSFIGYYMPEIDQSGDYGHVAETFIGLTLMLAERSVGEQQMKSTFEDITIADFE